MSSKGTEKTAKELELEDYNENLSYENKRMGDFLEFLGLSVDSITDNVINGSKEEWGNIFPSLKLYSDDFRKQYEWSSICDKLNIESNSDEVEIFYCRVKG